MTSTQETFNALVAHLDYPMFIATVADGEELAGCLVGFATQCSIDPPRFLICISNKNRTYRVSRGSSAMAVHLVPEEATELAELFGGRTGDDVDKFEHCSWRPGPEGLPLLDGCPNRFVARVLERTEAGDHDAFVLEPFFAEEDERGSEAFSFHRAKRIEPGHEA